MKHYSLTSGRMETCRASSPDRCPFYQELAKDIAQINSIAVDAELLHDEFNGKMYAENLLEKLHRPLNGFNVKAPRSVKVAPTENSFFHDLQLTPEDVQNEAKRVRAETLQMYKNIFGSFKPVEKTREEDRALNSYKWSGYRWMNQHLRSPGSVKQEELGMGEDLSMPAHLQNLIEKQPLTEQEFTVWRGGSIPGIREISQAEIDLINNGQPKIVTLQGFTSTSLSQSIFKRFRKPNRLKLTILPGSQVLPIDEYLVGGASLEHEKEILLPDQAQIRVTKIEQINGLSCVYAELLPKNVQNGTFLP